MKRFNSNKVRALGNLQSKTELQKRRDRAAKGVKKLFSVDGYDDRNKSLKTPSEQSVERKWLAPRKLGYVPAKPRGRSGTRLNAETREYLVAQSLAREAFFAGLRGE